MSGKLAVSFPHTHLALDKFVPVVVWEWSVMESEQQRLSSPVTIYINKLHLIFRPNITYLIHPKWAINGDRECFWNQSSCFYFCFLPVKKIRIYLVGDSRGVDDKSIPLAFDVIIRWLLGDVQAIKFKLPGNLLLPLKNHQRNLKSKH